MPSTAAWLNSALVVNGRILYNAAERRGAAAPTRTSPATASHMDISDENSKPGRKPVLDDAKRREICAILAIGGTRRMAARYVGSADGSPIGS